ncbi:heme-binding protein [Tropicimonas sp. TH_r6]|uniref:GlcG/HbpS family heme-binding protein n=1 Tax=Tropicimonas sp. TH_r6 TaxID=3082085 RepID=UPI0029532E46|nr:heme-binding protein [Tropicimonas sp. TH_r6]MDV7143965.1 heme-binding protein [Tropicimonas sp. TH_r6]
MQTAEIIDRLLSEALDVAREGRGDVTLAEAVGLAARAEARARAMGVPVAISVADRQGRQILFHRMADILPASAQLASDKAWTAAALRMGTHELGQLAQPGGMLFGVQATLGGRVVIFGGGLPIARNGMLCGAIGISGGTVEEDIQIARHALGDRFDEAGAGPKAE